MKTNTTSLFKFTQTSERIYKIHRPDGQFVGFYNVALDQFNFAISSNSKFTPHEMVELSKLALAIKVSSSDELHPPGITTVEQFLESEVTDYSQAYNGKDQYCRCGCGGTYASTSVAVNPRSEVNDRRVANRLAYAKKIAMADPTAVSFGDNFVNVSKGDNKAFTFYFDEVKES